MFYYTEDIKVNDNDMFIDENWLVSEIGTDHFFSCIRNGVYCPYFDNCDLADVPIPPTRGEVRILCKIFKIQKYIDPFEIP